MMKEGEGDKNGAKKGETETLMKNKSGKSLKKARGRAERKSHQFHVYMRAFIHFDWIIGGVYEKRKILQ